MLTATTLENILERIPDLTVGVLGDLFLDRYLDIDAALTEPSVETGLDAYQVVAVRASPGAAGTVINNLAALGVRCIPAIAVIGDDGEGYELRRALADLRVVDTEAVVPRTDRRTPTYTKPMVHQAGRPPRELNRLDIKNHTPLPAAAEVAVLQALAKAWPQLDALVVLDQVDKRGNGVVTDCVVQRLAELGMAHADKLILADSRERIGRFRAVCLKPNQLECARALGGRKQAPDTIEACVAELARRTGRPVFCTCGDQGIWVVDPRLESQWSLRVPACAVVGPIDIVGAGDSTSAGIACAIAAGAGLEEAAAFGNLVASVTIQQIGTTGTASPDQVRQRWAEVTSQA
jgi:rfaE bifunctional protein kinase chain/domain